MNVMVPKKLTSSYFLPINGFSHKVNGVCQGQPSLHQRLHPNHFLLPNPSCFSDIYNKGITNIPVHTQSTRSFVAKITSYKW